MTTNCRYYYRSRQLPTPAQPPTPMQPIAQPVVQQIAPQVIQQPIQQPVQQHIAPANPPQPTQATQPVIQRQTTGGITYRRGFPQLRQKDITYIGDLSNEPRRPSIQPQPVQQVVPVQQPLVAPQLPSKSSQSTQQTNQTLNAVNQPVQTQTFKQVVYGPTQQQDVQAGPQANQVGQVIIPTAQPAPQITPQVSAPVIRTREVAPQVPQTPPQVVQQIAAQPVQQVQQVVPQVSTEMELEDIQDTPTEAPAEIIPDETYESIYKYLSVTYSDILRKNNLKHLANIIDKSGKVIVDADDIVEVISDILNCDPHIIKIGYIDKVKGGCLCSKVELIKDISGIFITVDNYDYDFKTYWNREYNMLLEDLNLSLSKCTVKLGRQIEV